MTAAPAPIPTLLPTAASTASALSAERRLTLPKLLTPSHGGGAITRRGGGTTTWRGHGEQVRFVRRRQPLRAAVAAETSSASQQICCVDHARRVRRDCRALHHRRRASPSLPVAVIPPRRPSGRHHTRASLSRHAEPHCAKLSLSLCRLAALRRSETSTSPSCRAAPAPVAVTPRRASPSLAHLSRDVLVHIALGGSQVTDALCGASLVAVSTALRQFSPIAVAPLPWPSLPTAAAPLLSARKY